MEMENSGCGAFSENIETYTTPCGTLVVGQIKGTNDLFMRKTYYQVSLPEPEASNIGTCEKKTISLNLPYAANELKYLEGTLREKYIELFKNNCRNENIRSALEPFIKGIIDTSKYDRHSSYDSSSDEDEEDDYYRGNIDDYFNKFD